MKLILLRKNLKRCGHEAVGIYSQLNRYGSYGRLLLSFGGVMTHETKTRIDLANEAESHDIMTRYNSAFENAVNGWGRNGCRTNLSKHLEDELEKKRLIPAKVN